LRGHRQSTFHTLHWLRHLERIGIPVVNGSKVYSFELSKASQLDLLEELGLPYPRARAINHPSLAAVAAKGLRYPVLVKANIGGSGAGIMRYETEAALVGAIERGEVELGVDGVALVQESAPLRNGHIVRVETLGGKYLYAIKVYPAVGSFDLCPADACQTTTGVELVRGACAIDAPKTGLRVEGYEPPRHIVEQVEAISHRAGLDVGGIEYLIDDRDGKHYFYDVNALSNFVADPENVIGFNPWTKLVDFLEGSGKREAGRGGPRDEGRANDTTPVPVPAVSAVPSSPEPLPASSL
jgi:biotin carboxylase